MLRTHQRMHTVSAHDDNADDNELSPEQVLTGIGLLIAFALATGLVYALIDALL
jgi:hypothetical protein